MSCHRYIFHISLPIPERATSLYSYSNAPHRSSITDLPSPRPRPRRLAGDLALADSKPSLPKDARRCDRMRRSRSHVDAIECDATLRGSHVLNQIMPDSMNTASSNWLHHETHILSFVASPRRRGQRHPDEVIRSSVPGNDGECTSAAICKMPLAQWSVRLCKTNAISLARFTNTHDCLNIFSVSFAAQTSQQICLPSFY